jgi:peptidoglycan/xylan/chitin deacetylase (PgdA/CDA1 family)
LEHDPWQLSVSPAHFEEHMRILQKHGIPMPCLKVAQCRQRIFGKRISFGITFDDGYMDNFYNARPILKKLKIPATFFIVSGMVGKKEEFWWDRLGRIILSDQPIPEAFSMTIAGKKYQWCIELRNNEKSRAYGQESASVPGENVMLSSIQLYYALWQILFDLPMPMKGEVLRQIEAWAGHTILPRPDFFPMTAKELMSLSEEPLFEIGAHTTGHVPLSRLTVQEQEAEIAKCKQDLEGIIGKSVTAFSYPHGEYSEETVRILQKMNFNYATTVSEGLVRRGADPFRLPRFGVLDWAGEQFEQKLIQFISQHQEKR